MIECILMLDIDQVSLLQEHSSVLQMDLVPVTDNDIITQFSGCQHTSQSMKLSSDLPLQQA